MLGGVILGRPKPKKKYVNIENKKKDLKNVRMTQMFLRSYYRPPFFLFASFFFKNYKLLLDALSLPLVPKLLIFCS